MFTKVEKNVQTIHDTLDVLSHACYKFHTLKHNICDDKTKINRSINSRNALRENNYQQRHWDTLNFRTQYLCQTYKS